MVSQLERSGLSADSVTGTLTIRAGRLPARLLSACWSECQEGLGDLKSHDWRQEGKCYLSVSSSTARRIHELWKLLCPPLKEKKRKKGTLRGWKPGLLSFFKLLMKARILRGTEQTCPGDTMQICKPNQKQANAGNLPSLWRFLVLFLSYRYVDLEVLNFLAGIIIRSLSKLRILTTAQL